MLAAVISSASDRSSGRATGAARAALVVTMSIAVRSGVISQPSNAPAIHRALLSRCQPLNGPAAIPAQRKARREYESRVNRLDAQHSTPTA